MENRPARDHLAIDRKLAETIESLQARTAWRCQRSSQRERWRRSAMMGETRSSRLRRTRNVSNKAVDAMRSFRWAHCKRICFGHHLQNTNCCFQVISFIWDGAKAAVREIIVADLRIFLDLGATQRAANLLIVLRLFLSNYPDARLVSPRWEGWDLVQKSPATRRLAPRRDEKPIAVRQSPPIDEKGG